jgi:L-threonylcarbamoyladenylate synthase
MVAESPSLPERIDLVHTDDPRDVVHRAVACLAQGGIVGLATETVYGLAASALRPEAVAELRRIQALDVSSPLTLLLRDPGEVADWVPHVSPLGRRLARRAWPGPVTLVFPSDGSHGLAQRLPAEVRPRIFPEGSVALRVPSNPFIREVLRLSPGPLVLSRALDARQGIATTPEELAGRAELRLLVDEGPTRLG